MKKTSKKVGIEDLAVVVKQGFDHIDDKFLKVDKRFDEVDKRFDAMEHHFNNKIEGLELKISSYASSWDKNFDRLHDEDRAVGVNNS